MFRVSSSSLMAEDVTIRCRVRRSPFASNPKFDQAKEMTCTMRNWERCRRANKNRATSRSRASSIPHRRVGAVNDECKNEDDRVSAQDFDGPELLLTPIREILTTSREESPPVRRLALHQLNSQEAQHQHHHGNTSSYSIPVSDIMVMDTNTCHSQQQRGRQQPRATSSATTLAIYLTTLTFGFFEFTCDNKNGRDILLAFLKASLAPERVLDGSHYDNDSDDDEDENSKNNSKKDKDKNYHPSIKSSSSVTSCLLDVDALTSKHLQGRAERETWPEKMSRRVGKVVNTLSECLSNANQNLCFGLACCLDDVSGGNNEQEKREKATSPRSMPQLQSQHHHALQQRDRDHHQQRLQHRRLRSVPSSFRYSDLELDDNLTATDTESASQKQQLHQQQILLPQHPRQKLSLRHTIVSFSPSPSPPPSALSGGRAGGAGGKQQQQAPSLVSEQLHYELCRKVSC